MIGRGFETLRHRRRVPQRISKTGRWVHQMNKMIMMMMMMMMIVNMALIMMMSLIKVHATNSS